MAYTFALRGKCSLYKMDRIIIIIIYIYTYIYIEPAPQLLDTLISSLRYRAQNSLLLHYHPFSRCGKEGVMDYVLESVARPIRFAALVIRLKYMLILYYNKINWPIPLMYI